MARKRKSSRWLQDRRRDGFVHQADAAGYRSRAAFKLLQMDRKDRLFRPAQTVLDLGAAPGSWSQVAAQRVAPGGRVVAVDRLNIEPIAGVDVVHGDITQHSVRSAISKLLPDGGADLVISDMAPNITGIGAVDEAQWMTLLDTVSAIAPQMLQAGGKLVIKLFEYPEIARWRSRFRPRFTADAVRKPDASRAQSREYYVVFSGFRGK